MDIPVKTAPVAPSKADIEKVRDLFALSHDLIAQAQFPGHLSAKIAESMNFLGFQYQDFKRRVEAMDAALAKPAESVVATADTSVEAPAPVVAEAPPAA